MKDNVNKLGKWEFDKEVTDCFDNMISRSIPGYDAMRELTFKLGRRFVPINGLIADIGCSNGLSMWSFINYFKGRASYVLSDVSEPMLLSCKERYKDLSKECDIKIVNSDLRFGLPFKEASLVVSSLTLQFTPIEYRQDILTRIYDAINPGGAFILVEKVIGDGSRIDSLLIDEYYDMKREHGYTEEQITNKRHSLEGVLVPLTSNFNVAMLKKVGFEDVDCFWRHLNFCAWIALKK